MWTAWIPSRFLICPQMTSTVRFWFHIYSNDVRIWPSCSPDLFLVKCLKDKVTRKKADDDNRSLSSSSSLEFIRCVKHEVSSRIKLILCVCVCGCMKSTQLLRGSDLMVSDFIRINRRKNSPQRRHGEEESKTHPTAQPPLIISVTFSSFGVEVVNMEPPSWADVLTPG